MRALPPQSLAASAAAFRQATAALGRRRPLPRSGLRNAPSCKRWRLRAVPSTLPPPHLLALQMASASRLPADGTGEILIALCNSGCPASRGFLPRGLSDAGPGGCRELRHGPASESLHMNCRFLNEIHESAHSLAAEGIAAIARTGKENRKDSIIYSRPTCVSQVTHMLVVHAFLGWCRASFE